MKKIATTFLIMVFALLQLHAQGNKIILVTDDDKDDAQYEWLMLQGFDVSKLWTGNLSEVGQDTIDMLNAADLVIIGRSPSSSEFESPAKEVWNALTAPLILNGQYDARSTKINWFNSTKAYHANEGPLVAYGVVSDPTDPIFAGVTLEGDSLGWCYPAHDFLEHDSVTNGDVLVSYMGNNPLVVRFAANVEFYPGSVDMPAASRTYFGFGNDKMGVNYFPLSKEAKAVYLAEICLMTGNAVKVPVFGAADNRIVLVTDDEKDDLQYEFLMRQGFSVSKLWTGAISEVGQDTLDMLNAADLVIIGRSPSSSEFETPDKEVWNALTTPLILNGQYDARSSKINWFNSTKTYHANEGPAVAYGVVSDPADPIFADVTLDGDSLGWCYPAHDFLEHDSASNGTILVSYNGNNPLIARFDAGIEFYPGSVDLPAAPRTYFGFGNDKVGVNYFPLTRDAKKVYLAEVSRMVGIDVPDIVYGAADFNITFVSDDDKDDPQVNFLMKNGIRVTELYPGAISEAGQDTIDMLNAADLIIVGRSPSSSEFESPDKEVWNALTAPLILNGQYDARSTKINWFNSTKAYHANEEPALAYGLTGLPDDVIFSNVTLDGDSLAWCMAPHDFLEHDSVTNGTIVASWNGNNPLLARFDADMEFYPGSVDMPAAPRTYFGFGNDKMDYANYFPLTPEGQQVYLNEISRMLNADLSIVKTLDSNALLDSLKFSDETATLTPIFDPDSMNYSMQLAENGAALIEWTAMAASEYSVVKGDSAMDVSMGDTITRVFVVTAENGNSSFYKLTVYPYVDPSTAIRQELENASLKLYPNPTSDQLYIVAESGISHVSVYNTLGKLVFDQSYGNIDKVQVNVSSLITGVYLIRVNYDARSSMTKFIKK